MFCISLPKMQAHKISNGTENRAGHNRNTASINSTNMSSLEWKRKSTSHEQTNKWQHFQTQNTKAQSAIGLPILSTRLRGWNASSLPTVTRPQIEQDQRHNVAICYVSVYHICSNTKDQQQRKTEGSRHKSSLKWKKEIVQITTKSHKSYKPTTRTHISEHYLDEKQFQVPR